MVGPVDRARRRWRGAHAGPRLPAIRRPLGREGGWHEIHVGGGDCHDGSHMGERSYACQGLHRQVTWRT